MIKLVNRKKTSVLFGSLIVIVLVLITGFIVFGYSNKKNSKKTATEGNSASLESITKTPQASATGQVAGEQVYVVKSGDTLFSISVKYNVKLDVLAAYNGLVDPYPIQVGQTIKIPPLDGSYSASNPKEKNYNLDLDQLKQVQASVDDGRQPWRLDPVQTAQAEVPPTFNITATDDYQLESNDIQKGQAIVIVTHDKIKYEILLVQPIRKGNSGIWATQKVTKKD